MKRTLLVLLAVATVAALPACSGGGGRDLMASPTSTPPTEAPSTTSQADTTQAPACDEVFVDDRQISDQEWQTGCTDADGSLVVAASYGYDCGTAWSNDLGWGYGGGPFHAGQPLPGLEVLSTCQD